MPRSWFAVQASAPNTAEIAIRGLIGEWGITDRDLIAEVEALGDVQEITLRINSRGGEVDHALSIFNYLREHPANVTVRIEGVAMSAATIVMLSGNKIVMPANTLIMVHNPWSYAAGSADDLRAEADTLEKFQQLLVDTYVARTGRSAEEIQALLDDESYLTATEAKDLGFCDEVEALPSGRSASALAAVMACAMGIPEDVLAKVQAAEAQADSSQDNLNSAAGAPEGGDPVSGDPAAQAGEQGAAPAAPVAAAGTLAAQIVALAGEFGLQDHISVFALATDIACTATARSAMQAACEVRDLCSAVGMADQAPSLIQTRSTVAEARAALQTMMADRADAQPVSNRQPNAQAKPVQTAQEVWAKVIPTLAS